MSEQNSKVKMCPNCKKTLPIEVQFCGECGAIAVEMEVDSKPSFEEVRAMDAANNGESGLFAHPGKKIKVLAKIGFFIFTTIAVIAAIYCFKLAGDSYYLKKTMILIGLAILILVPLAAWEIALYLCGYGEIVDKVSSIEKMLQSGNSKKD